MSAGRMDDHSRRLVDDHQLLVFVKDLQGDVFRAGRLAGDFRQDDGDPLAFVQAVGGLAAAAVHLRPAGGDHPPQMRAAVVLEVDRQKGVQPLARFRGGDDQLDGLGGKRRLGGAVHWGLSQFSRRRRRCPQYSRDRRENGTVPFGAAKDGPVPACRATFSASKASLAPKASPGSKVSLASKVSLGSKVSPASRRPSIPFRPPPA